MGSSGTISVSQRSRLQRTFTGSLPDVCHILRPVTGGKDENGVPVTTLEEDQEDVLCGLDLRNSLEVLQGTQVSIYDARLRLPAGTSITNLCQVRITWRFGSPLEAPLLFEVTGPPKEGPLGLLVELRTVTTG